MKSIFEYVIQVLITELITYNRKNCVSLLSNTIKIQPEPGSALQTIELMQHAENIVVVPQDH